MGVTETTDYEHILKIVATWPPTQRFALLQDVFKTLAAEAEPAQLKRPTLDLALGLLACGRPAPSDAEVQQWLEEDRLEKYG